MVGIRAVVPVAASALGFLDTGATVVMLPSIADDLRVPVSDTQGTLSLVLLLVGLMVVPAGALVDRIGPARVGRAGLILGGLACLATAFARDAGVLLAARAAFGLSAGLFLPAALAETGDSRDGNRSLIRWTVVVSVVTLAAPSVGALASTFSWRALYLAEGLCALVLAVAWARARRTARRPRPTGPIRYRPFVFLQAITAAAYAAFAGLPLLLSVYLQEVRGFPPLVVGLLLCIDGAVVVLLTPALGRVDGGGTARMRRVAVGAGLCATAILPLSLIDSGPTAVAYAIVGLLLVGAGSAFFIAPLTSLALDALGAGRSGKAAGLNLAVARVASAGGVALTSVIARPVFVAGDGGDQPAFRLGLLALAVLFALTSAIAATQLSRRRPAAQLSRWWPAARPEQEGDDQATGAGEADGAADGVWSRQRIVLAEVDQVQ